MTMAANLFFATPAQRTALARERFFERGERPLGLVSEPVLQSWHRSLVAGHRPEAVPAFDPVTKGQLRATLDRHHALLQAAAPEIDQLDTMLSGTACKTVLTDRHGIVVRASPATSAGGRGILDTAGRVGVNLGEDNLGCTAPGITAASGALVTVCGGEHFYGALHEVHCASAPIRDGSGHLLGVLDVSTEGQGFAFDALSLVRLAAVGIENRLFTRQARGHVLLRFQASPQLLGTPLEGLAAVDERGRVAWVNPAGLALLRRPAEGQAGDELEALFGMTLTALLAHTRDGSATPHRLPSGLQIHLRASLGEAAPPSPASTQAPMGAAAVQAALLAEASLRSLSQQAIDATLIRSRGNISAAARMLGVSRGLLYRRLKERATARASRPDGGEDFTAA
ncbi:helix-turn-helix domain-containing protein [Ideonella sp. YS5]|uniref:helix-turn-helix domain-containing protein n=1 Tax=Ideonella sp. YS5 TaxID=3453714 RepID=UPI003EEF8C06